MSRKDAKKYVLDAETGKYEYTGKRFYVAADEADFRRLKIGGTVLALVIVGLFVWGGLFLHGGFNEWYELTPYTFLILPGAWLVSRMVKLLPKKDELTESGAGLFTGIKTSAIGCIVLGVLAAVGQIVYTVMNGLSDGDILYIVLMLLIAVCGGFVFVLVQKCPVEPLYISENE